MPPTLLMDDGEPVQPQAFSDLGPENSTQDMSVGVGRMEKCGYSGGNTASARLDEHIMGNDFVYSILKKDGCM